MDFMALKKVVEHTFKSFKEHTTPGEQVIASDFFHVYNCSLSVLLFLAFRYFFVGTFDLDKSPYEY